MIKFIINGDDFCASKVFNGKILNLLEKGYIKSTTVMVNRVTEEQEGQIRQLSRLYNERIVGVGLHLEYDEKLPVRKAVESQYGRFVRIFDCPPSHIDFHKGRGMPEAQFIKMFTAGDKFAKEHGLPARNRGTAMTARHTAYPAFMCKDITLDFEEVTGFLLGVKDGSSCELITHPGEYDPFSKSSRNRERKVDYDVIVRLQDFLKTHPNFRNISYLEL
ncbi:MAG: ChbG/HpnK family deacetylase [Candidatus Aenigmatarchaeota archaeon]